ncbi:hypothetical protein CcCBS67573_g05912 [Chytriomyces confervae]|uniref:Nitrogen permease regulator 3 n=1 Tax=Chytriomyces confervae TaxID=246404 RepID=A0A507F708_9FUNG|nr:hypothetical protein CcCBS67573_g05912 [Chytriomyces confervae]
MVVVGVLLVCYSSRGHQLVFSYPLPATSNEPERDQHIHTVVRPGDAHPATINSINSANSAGSAPSSASASHTSDSDVDSLNSTGTRRLGQERRDANCLYSLQPQVLSDILSPKVALCDRMFMLAIDHLLFVGHPTLLNADRPGTGHRFARRIQRKQLLSESLDLADNLGHHDDDAWVGPSALNTPNPPTPLVPSNRPRAFSFGTSAISPLPQISTTTPVLSNYPSSPLVGSNVMGLNSGKPSNQQQQQQQQLQLTMFNIVFAIVPDGDEDAACEAHVLYSNVLAVITSGLKYEQLRRGYIKKETDIIMGIRDELHNGPGSFITRPTMKKILKESSLARLLVHIFDSVTNTTTSPSKPLTAFNSHTHVDLNSSVDISILIEKYVHCREESSSTAEDTSSNQHTRTSSTPANSSSSCQLSNMNQSQIMANRYSNHDRSSEHCANPMRPYQTLLLLYHAEEILKSLPADSAPLLHDLIEIVTPMRSLEDFATVLSCSLSHIYRLASHLVFWKKAKIISVINSRNMYTVSKNADLSRVSHLSNELNFRFKDSELGKLLSEMSYPRPISAIIKEKDLRMIPYLEIMALFLRNNLIEEIRMSILITIPKRMAPKSSESEGFFTPTQSPSIPDNLIIKSPADAPEHEWELIKRVAATQPAPLSDLFMRLAPYFDGKLCTEEIMYRESLSSRDLKVVLSRYREFLLTTYSSV